MTREQKLAVQTLKAFQEIGQEFETAKKNAIASLGATADFYRSEKLVLKAAFFASAKYYLLTLKFIHP